MLVVGETVAAAWPGARQRQTKNANACRNMIFGFSVKRHFTRLRLILFRTSFLPFLIRSDHRRSFQMEKSTTADLRLFSRQQVFHFIYISFSKQYSFWEIAVLLLLVFSTQQKQLLIDNTSAQQWRRRRRRRRRRRHRVSIRRIPQNPVSLETKQNWKFFRAESKMQNNNRTGFFLVLKSPPFKKSTKTWSDWKKYLNVIRFVTFYWISVLSAWVRVWVQSTTEWTDA